jgi:hypothetical protein
MFDRRNEFDRIVDGDRQIKLKSVPWRYDERKCVINFFAPRSIPDQTVRPFVCDFSIPFVSDLSETIKEAIQSHTASYGGNGFLDSYMTNKPSSNSFLKPDAYGVLFKSGFLSECWTWICFIDNDVYRGHSGNNYRLTNRLIYTGFVADREEPVTSSFGRQIINERAILVPTHFTQLNVQAERGVTGDGVLTVPTVDLDVVNPMATIVNSDREYLLRPEDLSQSMGAYESNREDEWFNRDTSLEFQDEPGNAWCSPEMCSLANKQHNILVNSLDKSPKHQISKIVRGLSQTILGTEADRFTSFEARMGRNVSFTDARSNLELFKNSVADKYPKNQIGLNINEPIDFGVLLRRYPSLQDHINVYLFKCDPMQYCPDDTAITPINLYTAVLRSAIPPVMSNCGISDCSFFYATREPRKGTAIFLGNNEPYYERLIGPYPFIEEDQSSTNYRWFQLKRFLSETVFPMVEDGLSADIECVVHYHSSSDCGINLSIVGENVNNDFLVNNDILGGLTTPLVGTEDNYYTNSQALRDVVNATTESKGF